jgi:hypothetical protein
MARSRTTFGPDNTAAVTHGTRSRHAVQQHASEVREELTALIGDHLPHLTPADGPLVDLAVDAMTKLRLMNAYFDRTSGGSLIDGRGRPRAAAELYLRVERNCIALFDRLGIGPTARAAILGSETGKRHLAIYQIAAEAQRARLVGPDEQPDRREP